MCLLGIIDRVGSVYVSRIAWVKISLIVAVGCGFFGLFGLVTRNAFLASFGSPTQPIGPLATVSFIALAAALYTSIRLGLWVRFTLLLIPVLVVFLAVLQGATGVALGGDGWSILHDTENEASRGFGRPYSETVAIVAVLTLAVAVAGQGGRRFSRLVGVLASVTLGVSVMSGIIVLFGIAPPGEGSHRFLISLPAAAQAIAISVALLVWGGWPEWANIPGRGPHRGTVLRRTLPLVVFVPALNALIEIFVGESGEFWPLVIDVSVAGTNIAIFATLIFWSISRVASEHAALWETANAMESAPIALTSLSGTIQHWSRGCTELYGWTVEQAVGRSKYEILKSCSADPKDSLPTPEDSGDRQLELIERRRDGTKVHVIERVRLVQAPGRPPVLVHEMTDITERIRIDAALKESDANLLLALDAQQIGTFDWDLATGKVVVSPGMEQRLGLQPGDLSNIGSWAERIEPADAMAIVESIGAGVRQHAARYNFHYRMNVPSGGTRTLEGTGRLIYDAEANLSKIVGVHIDVTDRNERENALLAEEEQLRLVLKTVPSAMVIFDKLGTIKAFSASAERMFGYTAKELIGRNVETLAVSPAIHKANSFVDRYLKGGKSYVTNGTSTTYAKRCDGTIIPIELWMGDLMVGSNQLFTAFARDLTERLRSEKRLTEVGDEMLHASRLSAMGEMVAGLAHELNQPLAATAYFLGAADLVLGEDEGREQGRSLLRLGIDQTLRTGEIIRRMREFATPNSIDMQVGRIGNIIEDAVSLAFLGNARFDIKLVYDLDPSADVILADRVQIAQVFVNLLRNATEALRKCPPTGRRITICTKAMGDEMMEVSVADNGPGLDISILDKLYMPFASTKHGKGMGVGLSICRRIIEAHGGTFDATNIPTGGALFSFMLQCPTLTLEANG